MVRDDGMTVAVTGAAGYLGRRLTAALAGDPRVGRVLCYDIRRPPLLTSPKIVFDQVDIRTSQLEKRLVGCDVLVHLAFIMDPIRDEAGMRDVNVNGSHEVFHSACRAGVNKIVYTSSATVYGAHHDNDIPLTESSPLRANLDFSYAAHKLEVEYMVRELRTQFPDRIFTVFRPAIVFGPDADNAWSHVLESPVLFGVEGHTPPMQFVHEDDVADALRFAVFEDLDGPYNLTADGWLEHGDAVAIVGRRWIALDEPRAFRVLDSLWRRGLSEVPAGSLHYVMHPWVVSGDELAEKGFRPRRSNAEALAEAVGRAHDHIRLGRRRFRRAHVRRGLAGAGVGAAAAGLWAARRTRAVG